MLTIYVWKLESVRVAFHLRMCMVARTGFEFTHETVRARNDFWTGISVNETRMKASADRSRIGITPYSNEGDVFLYDSATDAWLMIAGSQFVRDGQRLLLLVEFDRRCRNGFRIQRRLGDFDLGGIEDELLHRVLDITH